MLTKAKNKYFRIATFLQNKLIDRAAVNCNSKWRLRVSEEFLNWLSGTQSPPFRAPSEDGYDSTCSTM